MFKIFPENMVWARGRGQRALSYYISKFLIREKGPVEVVYLW